MNVGFTSDDQRDQYRREHRRQTDRLELVAPHPAQEARVLLGRDLPGVPRAPAALADPSARRREPPWSRRIRT